MGDAHARERRSSAMSREGTTGAGLPLLGNWLTMSGQTVRVLEYLSRLGRWPLCLGWRLGMSLLLGGLGLLSLSLQYSGCLRRLGLNRLRWKLSMHLLLPRDGWDMMEMLLRALQDLRGELSGHARVLGLTMWNMLEMGRRHGSVRQSGLGWRDSRGFFRGLSSHHGLDLLQA